MVRRRAAHWSFQSTLPLRGATVDVSNMAQWTVFQSTLPLRGATSPANIVELCGSDFNPHSPCGERPCRPKSFSSERKDFNPHSPCGERHDPLEFLQDGYKFQSTLPLRGATKPERKRNGPQHFNPHSPCGERRGLPPTVDERWLISIHTPLAGSDFTSKAIAPS